MFSFDFENNTHEIKINDEENTSTEKTNEIVTAKEAVVENAINKIDIKENETHSAEQNYFDQLHRLKAEFANYKKRIENERMLLSDIIKSDFINNLLPVIDDFERLIQYLNDEEYELKKGFRLVYEKLFETLRDQGLKPMKSIGEKFDPKFHEALSAEYYEGAEEEIVIEECRKGYSFKDKLLRPAQVKVNKVKNQKSVE